MPDDFRLGFAEPVLPAPLSSAAEVVEPGGKVLYDYDYSYSFRSSLTSADVADLSDAKVQAIMKTIRFLGSGHASGGNPRGGGPPIGGGTPIREPVSTGEAKRAVESK